jgi:hypothetical protein
MLQDHSNQEIPGSQTHMVERICTALRRSPLFPFPSHLAKFPFPSHLATFPSRGCARLELEKAAT